MEPVASAKCKTDSAAVVQVASNGSHRGEYEKPRLNQMNDGRAAAKADCKDRSLWSLWTCYARRGIEPQIPFHRA
jgi:hypothetical protein